MSIARKHKTYNFLFDGMDKYMFSQENMLQLKCEILANPRKEVQKLTPQKNLRKATKDNETLFFPRQDDMLFWCFYIIKHGFHEYEMCKLSSFKTEKEFKIGSVELLRNKKDKLKIAKLKLANIESELVNDKRITLSGLFALCIAHEVSVFFVSGSTYCDFDFDFAASNDSPNDAIVYDQQSKRVGVKNLHGVGGFKDTIKKTHFHITNPDKPINAISGYSLSDLQEICKKMSIPLLRSDGKRETKINLYQAILSKIDCK